MSHQIETLFFRIELCSNFRTGRGLCQVHGLQIGKFDDKSKNGNGIFEFGIKKQSIILTRLSRHGKLLPA